MPRKAISPKAGWRSHWRCRRRRHRRWSGHSSRRKISTRRLRICRSYLVQRSVLRENHWNTRVRVITSGRVPGGYSLERMRTLSTTREIVRGDMLCALEPTVALCLRLIFLSLWAPNAAKSARGSKTTCNLRNAFSSTQSIWRLYMDQLTHTESYLPKARTTVRFLSNVLRRARLSPFGILLLCHTGSSHSWSCFRCWF